MTTPISPAHVILPPPDPPGPMKWVRDNLLGSVSNTIMTIVSVVTVLFLISSSLRWVFVTADWRPITQAPLLYAIGQYPRDLMWRVGFGLSITVLLMGISWGKWGGLMRGIALATVGLLAILGALPVNHVQLDSAMRLFLLSNIIVVAVGYFVGRIPALKPTAIIIGWILLPVAVWIIFGGFGDTGAFEKVSMTAWGGLMVTLLLAFGGILLSFPIGIALALGRRSTLPILSGFSTVIIETIRGVPLITILFMFSLILNLFLPEEARIERLTRALMALTLFSSAYMAENIRGGLAAVPAGQIEAAKAVGMGNFQTMLFIVMPQAIRAVIPAIVGQFISLFKDTTLVVIVGINDLLGIGKSIINSNTEFVQLQTEVYIFIALIYWIFSYLMSIASRRVEFALGVGTR